MGQIVGAYPVYGSIADSTSVVAALAESPLVDGLEVPFRSGRIALPAAAPGDWHYVVTLLPETMSRLKRDSKFGLASRDPDGRSAAIDLVRDLHKRVVQSSARMLSVELHSAPTRTADPAVFTESLAEVASWDWGSTQVVVEHCDAWTDAHSPAKGFLPIAAELDAVYSAGCGLSLNWARSVIESRDPETGLAHVRAAVDRGVLQGLIFSSVSSQSTDFGPAWSDSHLAPVGTTYAPPGSLLTSGAIASTLAAAGEVWSGFKINMPPAVPLMARGAGLLEVAELIASVQPTVGGSRPDRSRVG